MNIIAKTGKDDLAFVYLAETENGQHIEFVESVQPPISRDKKWVLIVSTLLGCPVGCKICDAGGWYKGKLSSDEIFDQIDYLVESRYPDKNIPADNFKIQFARMGEPSFNEAVLDVLIALPNRYNAPGLTTSISTVAPNGTDRFFEQLIDIKNRLYSNGKFQMQFSIHSTDESIRDNLIPVKKWSFEKIALYGDRFYKSGDRKISLNFALATDSPVKIEPLLNYFDPSKFLIKLTPVNPTITARENRISDGLLSILDKSASVISQLKDYYEVIVSVGELEENLIGSNCGQYVRKFIENCDNQDSALCEKSYNYLLKSY